MTIVVPKLRSLILRVRRMVVQLLQCFVPTVQIFPENPKKISEMILLRSTVPQKLVLKLDVTFEFKVCLQEFPGFQALRQHENT